MGAVRLVFHAELRRRWRSGLAIAWRATRLALVGIAIGIPLGVVIGRAMRRAFARGAVPVAAAPTLLAAGVAAGLIVVANCIAVTPALAATRSKPGSSSERPK